MNRVYTIKDCNIRVSLGDRLVCITNDGDLVGLLAGDPEPGTKQLVARIKRDYRELTGGELHIGDRSLAVEIWGHVYFEQLILALNRRVSLAPVNALAKAVSKRCRIIDAGEKSIDHNRIFWNLLAPWKTLLAKMLRGNGRAQ